LGFSATVGCDSSEEAVSNAAGPSSTGALKEACAGCPAKVPAALDPPSDVTIKASFAARGVQIYTCAASATGAAPAWTLKAPHAALTSRDGEIGAIHFAGPSWEATDGSTVTAARLASDPGPHADAIPWLLLQVKTVQGAGLFADVTYIQRLATSGGVAPTTGCDLDHLAAESLVPYRADYVFYHPASAGEPIHRCASR
jgi:hypothetical protein